jgi:nitrogen regulatory protein P-II 1
VAKTLICFFAGAYILSIKGEEQIMKKLEIVIRPDKLEDLKDLMNEKGIYGMTVYMVNGCGQQRGRKVMYRGTEVSINLLPKVKVEMVLSDSAAEGLIPEIINTVKTGQVGDGKIFVYECSEAYRVRTGESGEEIL